MDAITGARWRVFTKVVVEKIGKSRWIWPRSKVNGSVYGLDMVRESERRFGLNHWNQWWFAEMEK